MKAGHVGDDQHAVDGCSCHTYSKNCVSSLVSDATHCVSLAHLGERRGFDSIGGAVVSTTAFVFAKGTCAIRPSRGLVHMCG